MSGAPASGPARRSQALTDSDRARMLQASALMAHDALRVLALAERPLDELSVTLR